MIPLPPVYLSIESKINQGIISGREASDALYAERTKLGAPWSWKSWKDARPSFLKSYCEQCNAGPEKILTLQHTVKIPSLKRCVEEAKHASGTYENLQIQKKVIEKDTIAGERSCCPKCNSTAIYYRKRTKDWICNSKVNRRHCGHLFDAPGTTIALTPEQKHQISQQKTAAWLAWRDENKDEWLSTGILLWFQKMRRYLSFQDTKTFCRRCAFMEDKTDQKPCISCGNGVHRSAKSCPKCNTTFPPR